MAWVLSVDNNLFNEMRPLDELHTSTVAIFDLYNTKRDKLLERFGAQMEGTIGMIFLTPEQEKCCALGAAELDQLVEVMIQRSHDSKECSVAFNNLTAVVSKEFSMKLRFDKKPGVP